MNKQKKLLIEQFDKRLEPFIKIRGIQVPERGWIFSIRTMLNMSLQQLGRKLNITSQGVKDIELREVSGAISIKSLKDVAKALDMQFVYGFVPNQNSLDKYIDEKSKALALKIVQRTNHNMKLENQANSKERISVAIEELADELKREIKKSLWD